MEGAPPVQDAKVWLGDANMKTPEAVCHGAGEVVTGMTRREAVRPTLRSA